MQIKLLTIAIVCMLLCGCTAINNGKVEVEQSLNKSETSDNNLQNHVSETIDIHPISKVDESIDSHDAVNEYELNNIDIEKEEEQPVKKYGLQEGFVYLDDIVPYASYDIRYYSENNFVGEQIAGYNAPLAIGTMELALALQAVSEDFYEQGYKLLIYDTYRPAKAVSFLKDWAKTDNMKMQEKYYPNEQKDKLFQRGYLASRSGHSRGSTVDLTLLYYDTNELVDMGSDYDLLDEISSFTTTKITEQQAENRILLKNMMKKHGFKEYSKEWWHYVLINEPYPNTYFDFDIQ